MLKSYKNFYVENFNKTYQQVEKNLNKKKVKNKFTISKTISSFLNIENKKFNLTREGNKKWQMH